MFQVYSEPNCVQIFLFLTSRRGFRKISGRNNLIKNQKRQIFSK